MARHRELDELSGRLPHKYASTEGVSSQKRIDTDITTILQRMIQHSGQDVDESRMPIPGPPRINTNIDHLIDPEELGPWPFPRGPEDYPADNEG